MMLECKKRDLRRVMRRHRQNNATSPLLVNALINRLAATVLAMAEVRKLGCVWPLPGEPDLRPLCSLLYEAGRTVLLPETTPKGQPLRFRLWTPERRMVAGRFGSEHPDGPTDRPEMILVPLLAFDRSLNRLGYGGGYYDRTIMALGCRTTGFAFSWQEVKQVPVGSHDQPLDQIVTELEIIIRTQPEGEAG